MKVFAKNAIIKKILIIFITIIMTSNFIMPNYVHAEDDEKGGALFTPITELLVGIADRVMAALQGIFLGELNWKDAISAEEIVIEGPSEEGNINFAGWDGNVAFYNIKYSPAVIFSGSVPAFDINFIEPMKKEETTLKTPVYKFEKAEEERVTWSYVREKYGAPDILTLQKGGTLWWIITGNVDTFYATWKFKGIEYYFVSNQKNDAFLDLNIGIEGAWNTIKTSLKLSTDLIEKLYGVNINVDDARKGTLYTYSKVGTESITKESTAGVLRPQIATWYVALRTFALVGLLSVLVYIGIRIILSSGSSQSKAKYKEMLKDWIVAICILFLLHYIMAFTLEITEKIGNVFETTTIDEFGRDVLMSDIRTTIGSGGNYFTYFGVVIMYLALVILTVTFTIEYLKRVIFIAFLTMIAPLIALTYPLDKIKDGKAQAFSTWIKEYVFNCLIQPVHLLLYTVFIESATSLLSVNPIYAIVALAFFRPAEKFFKKMFGFESAQGMSALGAAAGGAMVMNMLNKMQGKGAKGKDGKDGDAGSGASSKTNNVRTATRNGATTTTAGTPPPLPGGGKPPPAKGGVGQHNTTPTPSTANGFKALGKKITSPSALKSVGSWTVRNSTKAAGAIAGATIGLAAEVADGDFENPLKNIAIGAGVGATTASNLASNTAHGAKKLYNSASETYQRGKYGDEAYNNMQFDKKFYESDAYKQILQDPSIDQTNIKVRTQEFLDNGITDGAQIREALQKGISGDEYKVYSNSGINSVSQMNKLQSAGIDAQVYKDIYKDKGIDDTTKIARLKAKYPKMSNEALSNWMVLAKNKPNSLEDFKHQWVGKRWNKLYVDDGMAERIYKQINNFF